MAGATGSTVVAEEVLRVLPDPVEGDQIAAFLKPYGVTLDEIICRMGGTTERCTAAGLRWPRR